MIKTASESYTQMPLLLITDGAYSTMIKRITSSDNPDLFVMQYSADFQVVNLIIESLIANFSAVKDSIMRLA